jgi:predicted dehydrogenase
MNHSRQQLYFYRDYRELLHREEIDGDVYERRRIAESLALPYRDSHLEEMKHFCRVIRGDEESRCSGVDAKRSLRLLLAVIEAVDENRTVETKQP